MILCGSISAFLRHFFVKEDTCGWPIELGGSTDVAHLLREPLVSLWAATSINSHVCSRFSFLTDSSFLVSSSSFFHKIPRASFVASSSYLRSADIYTSGMEANLHRPYPPYVQKIRTVYTVKSIIHIIGTSPLCVATTNWRRDGQLMGAHGSFASSPSLGSR